jgi:hypothetical protein
VPADNSLYHSVHERDRVERLHREGLGSPRKIVVCTHFHAASPLEDQLRPARAARKAQLVPAPHPLLQACSPRSVTLASTANGTLTHVLDDILLPGVPISMVPDLVRGIRLAQMRGNDVRVTIVQHSLDEQRRDRWDVNHSGRAGTRPQMYTSHQHPVPQHEVWYHLQ